MAQQDTIVVLGGGATAAAAVQGLRDGGHEGPIVLVSREQALPYDWMAIAEHALTDVPGARPLHPYDREWYAAAGVELRLGEEAIRLDRDRRRVVLASGEEVAYDRILLATGTTPFPLGVPGEAAARRAGVLHDLESLAAATALREALMAGGDVVVAGDGWAAEAAVRAARYWGGHVAWLVPAAAPLARSLGEEGGTHLAGVHQDNGVDVHSSTTVAELRAGGGVRTSTGDVLPARVVVAAAAPAAAGSLARAAGLHVGDGIVVDAEFRTADPAVSAAGSCADVRTASGDTLRLDAWVDGERQGYAAGRCLAGASAPWDGLPHYAVSAYGTDLRFWGSVAGGYDAVVFRGEDEGEDDESLENFTAFWLRESRVVAAMTVDLDDEAPATLVGRPGIIDVRRLADLSTPLRAFAS